MRAFDASHGSHQRLLGVPPSDPWLGLVSRVGLLRLTAASISVPSTVKCSLLNNPNSAA